MGDGGSSLGLGSTVSGVDPRNADGSTKQRSAWGQLGGALSGADAFSDIQAMRVGTKNNFNAQAYQSDNGAYQIGNQYGGVLDNALVNAQGRQTPNANAATINQGQSDQWRNTQQSLAGALAARANGTGGPSAADLQMQQGLGQANAAQASQAASARGMTPAMAQRLAANNMATNQVNIAGQGAALRANETTSAQGQLASLSDSARGQDIGIAGQQAGFQQQAGLANQTASLQNQGQMDQATQAYLAMGRSREDAQQAAYGSQQALAAGQQSSTNTLNQLTASQDADRQQKANGGMIGAAGSIIGGIFSDVRMKKEIEPAPKQDLAQFLTTNNPQQDLDRIGGAWERGRISDDEARRATDAAKARLGPRDAYESVQDDLMAGRIAPDEAQQWNTQLRRVDDNNAATSAQAQQAVQNVASKQDTGDFLDALKAYKYKYKDPRYGQGDQYGVMAQDLEKSKMGSAFVEDTPEGKMVDYGKGFGAVLAAQQSLHERVKALEGKGDNNG